MKKLLLAAAFMFVLICSASFGLFSNHSKVSADYVLAQMPTDASKMTSAEDQAYLQEVNTLLTENRAIARKIATKLGFPSSTTIPGTGDLPERNNALVIRNQMLFKQIASKLGVDSYTSVSTAPDLIQQNHMALRQNRIIVRDIFSSLGIPTVGKLPSTGSLVQQNRDLLMGNKSSLTKIASEIGA